MGIKSSSIQIILDFKIDNNTIKEMISGEDSITVIHLLLNNFQYNDKTINYNYEVNLV